MTEFKPFQVIWKLLPYSFMWRTDYILDAIKCTSISESFCGIRSLWTKPKRCTMVSLFCSFGLVWFLISLNLFLLSLISTSLPLMAPGHHKDDQVQQGNITIHAFTDTFLGTRCVSFHHYFSFIMTVNSLIQRLVILPNLLIPYLNLYSSSHLLSSYLISETYQDFIVSFKISTN